MAEFVIFRDDPVHAHLGGKLDFFSRFLVGRVCRCDDQAITAFAQYDDAAGLAYLVIQQILWQTRRIDGIDIEKGRAKDGRHRMRQVSGGDSPGAGQFGNETGAVGLGLLVNVLGRFLTQLACGHQRPAQSGKCNGRGFFGGSIDSGHDTVRRRGKKASYHPRLRIGRTTPDVGHCATAMGGKYHWPRIDGRGERIRTSGLYVPNVALYQAKLHPANRCGTCAPCPPAGIDAIPQAQWRPSSNGAGNSSKPLESAFDGSCCAADIARRASVQAAARVTSSAPVACTMPTISASCSVEPSLMAWRTISACPGLPRCIAAISGSVALPSRRSSPRFLPISALSPS